MRRSICSVAFATLALAAAGPAHAATKVNRYSPWDRDGNPVLKKYVHGSAGCSGASHYSNRADAWRCVSGNTVLDPCFHSPTDDEVFCAVSPWARSGHLLGAVVEPTDHGRSPAPGPWAIQVGRRRCTFVRPRRLRRGQRRRPTYKCARTRRGGRLFLYGRPNTRRSTWTIRSARNSRGRRLKRVRVRAAWQ